MKASYIGILALVMTLVLLSCGVVQAQKSDDFGRPALANAAEVVVDDSFRVVVNRDRTIADGVAAGKYTFAAISSRNDTCFQRTGTGTDSTKIILVHFSNPIIFKKALEELEMCNFRPTDLQELLAIGEQYPAKQRKYPIYAFGSSWRLPEGFRLVPCLNSDRWDHSVRQLCLYAVFDYDDVSTDADVSSTGYIPDRIAVVRK